MSMYQQFETNPDLEKKGVVIDYGDFRVTLARAGGANQQYQKVLAAKSKPLRRLIDHELIDTKRATQLLRETLVEACILRWETKVDGEWRDGIENPDGGDLLPFTAENVVATFERLPDLFDALNAEASKAALYRRDLMEAEAGN